MSVEAQHMLRLTRILEQRGIPVAPVLSAAAASGASTLYLGIGAFSERLDLLLPFHTDVLAACAPGGDAAAIDPRVLLRICAEGDKLVVATVLGGTMSISDAAAEVAPGAQALSAWLPILDALVAAGGTFRNRSRALGKQRGAIALRFAPRSGADEEQSCRSIAALLPRIEIAAAQQTLWNAVYAEAGAGAGVVVTTECSATGPAAVLAFRFGAATWDRAIDLTKVLAGTSERATDIAATLGTLAGTLEVDELRGVELVMGEGGPDLLVWIQPRQDR